MALSESQLSDLIRRYEEGPEKLAAALAKVPRDAIKWRPGPEKWSAHEVIVHCADSETNAAMRIRYLVCETDPQIIGYDQAHWAKVLDYHTLPMEPALATVRAVRQNTTALLRKLPASAWERAGTHSESGRFTAERWLEIYAEHLEKHTQQIERNIAAWRTEETHPS